LSNAPILLLDEVTRSLDATSAREVQSTIDQIAKNHGRTVVMVAHRLESVTSADCVYVFERGRIVESGSHQQLLKAGGKYSEWAALAQVV
jgi:ABC-type multidrug transport system fused ATPase/permease subunit